MPSKWPIYTTAWTCGAISDPDMSASRWPHYSLKPLVFLLCLLPLIALIYSGFRDQLGANPVEAISQSTGSWTLRLLLLTLTVTPLRRISGWSGIVRIRRMLGLFTFFYACLHFLTYLIFDQSFDLQEIIKDVSKHPYVTVGFTAFLLLIPLAITSTNNMIRRLGRRWRQLHQCVYIIATLGVLHYLWLVKKDLRTPLIYATLLLVLLIYRAWHRRRLSS